MLTYCYSCSPQLRKDRGKRTSNRAQTRQLWRISIGTDSLWLKLCDRASQSFSHKLSVPIEILYPQLPLSTGHGCAAIQRSLEPAPRGWYCVQCGGSRLSGAESATTTACGWNSSIEREFWVQARSLVLFPIALSFLSCGLHLSQHVKDCVVCCGLLKQ